MFTFFTFFTIYILGNFHRFSCQLHFATLGNWGSGTREQYKVGETLKQNVVSSQLSFIVSPGSNFINDGIDSIEDAKWNSSFAQPYKDINLPFFAVLGAEDWKGNTTAMAEKYQTERLPASINDTLYPKWKFPNWWYHYSRHFKDASGSDGINIDQETSVIFIFVDTFILSNEFPLSNITQLHWNDLSDSLNYASKIFDWIIVVGNKPIISSGSTHGDAYLEKTLGHMLNSFAVDAYISGYDYNMEILQKKNLTLINCGSSSKADNRNKLKSKYSKEFISKTGFCHHILFKNKLVTEFIDGQDGAILSSYEIERRSSRQHSNRYNNYRLLPEVAFVPLELLPFNDVPPSDDWFTKTCGTVGLILLVYLLFIEATTISRQITRNLKAT